MKKKKKLLMPWNELQRCVYIAMEHERTEPNPSINGNKCSGDRYRIAPTEYKTAKNTEITAKKRINNGTKKKMSVLFILKQAKARDVEEERQTPFLMSNFTIDCTIANTRRNNYFRQDFRTNTFIACCNGTIVWSLAFDCEQYPNNSEMWCSEIRLEVQ